MYEVYIDGKVLYYPGDDENVIIEPQLELALNDAGAFEFLLPPGNPEYENIQNRQSMIQVLKDEEEIFYGEVRSCGKDQDNIKECLVIGELAFLHDSIQPQAEYHDLTTRQMLETWLNEHNSQVEERKRFYVGIVTIHDTNDSLYRYTNRETTLDAIREKLVGRLGGYLRIRKVDGVRYLDWITLPEYGKYCEQPIEFGSNLLDYAENCSAEDLATAVIPLGARLEESPIEGLEAYTDITSVNGGVDYLYITEAVERYGWVRKVVTWDDVTIPANLKKKGEEWLKDNQYESLVLELTALDLSDLDSDYEAFALGDTVHASAWPYGMDRTFPVQEMTIYLQEPDRNRLTLGTTIRKNYTSQMKDSNKKVSTELDNVRQTTSWMQSAIDNATAMMTGSKGGHKISEYDEDGRWLRDLYMNAPNKEDASLVMQINMNGIGFSREGFEGPYKNAWTIDGVFLGEFIKAGSISAEKLSVEYRESVNEEIVAKFNVAAGKIEAEVTRAKGVEVDLAASLKVTADSVQTKVSKGEFGSYAQQYYDKVIFGFNSNSKYVQINPGEIAIYDNGVSDSKKRAAFNHNGSHFYRDGYHVGKIGTNQMQSDASKKGLVFDLENEAAYMSWSAAMSANANTYTQKWTYTLKGVGGQAADTLNAGCDIDMHGFSLKNVDLESVRVGNTRAWNGEIPIVTQVRDNGDGTIGWSYSTITVEDGIIMAAPRA
ncbi:hypothetical protein C824_001256 [Schaedlerella arabinosiphila]|nr:hypothetical protein C824_001256 [Schaedlerella arabinosiphila]